MAAENWLGINLGDILAQTEQIKNAQQTRAYNAIKIQQAQQERADELAKRDAYRQLFTAPTPTAGDVTGASNFATTGYNPAGLQALGEVDPEARLKLQEHFSKMSADQRELEGKKYIAAAPLAIKASKMPYETRKSFIAAASPYLQSQGWTPQEIAAFDPTDQNIQALGTIAMTAPQVLDSMKIEWHQQGENPSFATDAMGNPVGVGNPYAGSAVSAAPTSGASALAGNNPGGIIDSHFAKSQPGYQGANGRFAKFDTLQNGITAQTNLLQSYISRGFDTPTKIAARWAPAGDGANNPAQYAANIAKQMGIGVNDKIGPGQVAAFQQAQATQENAMYPQAQAGGGLPTTATPGFIPGVPKQNKDAPSGYQWNAAHTALQAIPGGPADKGGGDNIVPLGDTSKTGDAYLATLPKGIATQVKMLSEGRLPLPSSFALKTPYWQTLLQTAAVYDPTLDEANAKTRVAIRKEFTSGKAAANITSFNTVMGHLDSLDKSIDALHNSSFPMWNKIANFAAYESGDTKFQQAAKNFTASKNAVARELTRAFRMSGGNVSDVKDFEAELSAADSPEALHATVKKYVDLLASRINAMGEMYNTGMGRSSDPINLLDPKARRVFQRLGGETTSQGHATTSDGWGIQRH